LKGRILPKVISFINRFPENLKIISHCTRKSEVAVWSYLFSIVGDSRILFEKCLAMNDLETAGSYLIVLQNTEDIKECEKVKHLSRFCCIWKISFFLNKIILFIKVGKYASKSSAQRLSMGTHQGNSPVFVSYW
jgi:hypothetical protein